MADWDFEAVRLPSATMNHIDTPDTFALLNADTGARQQVVLWLAPGLEVLWAEPSFRRYQSGQRTVFSGAHNVIIIVLQS